MFWAHGFRGSCRWSAGFDLGKAEDGGRMWRNKTVPPGGQESEGK